MSASGVALQAAVENLNAFQDFVWGNIIPSIMKPKKRSIGPYHSMSKQKILPVEPLIQCEAGRAKTMQRQSLYSPRTPKWPPSDKGEFNVHSIK